MTPRKKAKAAAPKDPVTAYARDVVKKRVVAGPHVRNACARHLRDLKEGKKRKLVWRLKEALRVIDFFESELVLTGKKKFLLQPWQKFIVGSLFGWYMTDGTRRFNVGYVETAKGNGKTPLVAGIGLTGLCIDGEAEAEIYSAAVSKDQAKIVFTDAKRMVDDSESLDSLIDENFVNLLSITETRSVFRPVSAEHQGLDGKRPHMALIDELHEHDTALVLDKLRLGTKFRRNPLTISITNAGFDRLSVCWREHEYGAKVASGAVQNDSYFAYICALDDDDDYRDPKVWIKANPNLGVSVHERYIRQLLVEAEGLPSKLNLILRLNFCVWTESHTVWVPDSIWAENAGTAGPAQIAKVNKRRPTWIGLEISATTDFCSAIALFPDEADGEAYDLLCRFWLCEEAFKRRLKLGREPYELWRSEGLITVTPGSATDYDAIERDLLSDAKTYDVREVVFDRNWASSLVAHLQDALGEERLVQSGTTAAAMNSPINEIERLASRKKLRHGGNPVMRWQVSNVAIANSGGLKRVDKSKSTESVVGPIALAMAMGRAMVRNAPKPDNEVDDFYAEREVRYI